MDFRVESRRHRRIFKLQNKSSYQRRVYIGQALGGIFAIPSGLPLSFSLSLSLTRSLARSLSLFTKDTWYKGDYLKHLNSLYELPKKDHLASTRRRAVDFFPKINSPFSKSCDLYRGKKYANFY